MAYKGILRKRIRGVVYLVASSNNTIMTLCYPNKRVAGCFSAGLLGFSGSKRGTSYAGQMVGEHTAAIAKKKGIFNVDIYLKGLGEGQEASMRGLARQGVFVESVRDITPIPHGGCRPKKQRRV